jgi:hypothetical protein
MKRTQWMIGGLLAGAFVLAGCHKATQEQQGLPPMELRGVKVDLPKLQEAFKDNEELRPLAVDCLSDVRYGKNSDALAKLQKLAANPSLNDQQKKIVNDVIEQVKQLAAKTPQ